MPDFELDEHELLRRVANGEPDAIRKLYERYAPMVIRTAYRLLQDRDEADDVLQEVFIGLPEALRHYQERHTFDPWLRRVTARTALMRMRRERRRQHLLERKPGVGHGPGAEERLADGIALDHAISLLPEPLRIVFVLREIEGYSHREISDLLGIRRGTSEVRLFRANLQLREILKERI